MKPLESHQNLRTMLTRFVEGEKKGSLKNFSCYICDESHFMNNFLKWGYLKTSFMDKGVEETIYI